MSRVYSRYSQEAVSLLGKTIRLYRRERKITTTDLADRAGISRTTLHKIENGDMTCEIGLVFEVSAIVGIRLFDEDSSSIEAARNRVDDKIALLPKKVHSPKRPVDDDF